MRLPKLGEGYCAPTRPRFQIESSARVTCTRAEPNLNNNYFFISTFRPLLSDRSVGFCQYRLEVPQSFFHGERMQLTSAILTGFDGGLQIMTCDLYRQGIGNSISFALAIFHKRR